jgi:hypothetical protein
MACGSRTGKFLLRSLSKVLVLDSIENATALCAFHGIKTEDGYALLTKSTFVEANGKVK